MLRRDFLKKCLALGSLTWPPGLTLAGPARQQETSGQLAEQSVRGSPAWATICNVKSFGAQGDGKRNDTTAFAAACAQINRQGGGVLWIPPGTYLVGQQRFAGTHGKGYSWQGQPVISIHGCSRPVLISGHHARLRLANGMRYGAFDPVTGAVYQTPVNGEAGPDTSADCGSMIALYGNAEVVVQDLELDGNMDHLRLGGPSDGSGHQHNATGISCVLNRKVHLKNIHCHHHGLDGLYIGTDGQPPAGPTEHLLEHVVTEYNGRQGLSWTGGIGLTARYCRFNHTGQGRIRSEPASGVDIEPNAPAFCRNGLFSHCEFKHNYRNGLVSEHASGDAGYTTCHFCTFWGGATERVLRPENPAMTFVDCAIHGGIYKPWNDPNPALTTKFIRCTIDDAADPRTGITPLVKDMLIEGDLSHVLFQQCHISCTRTRCNR